MTTGPKAFYNEIDPYAAQWTRNLIKSGLIADGEVNGTSITELEPADLGGYTQAHFFSGVSVWSYALRQAGWPDSLECWTGSCPCTPFSSAGKRGGFDDKRHLWPDWFRLIRECRPRVVLGEQVSSRDGLAWFDTVCYSLEAEGYAVGALDIPAAGVGAPHIRQRLYFCAVRLADPTGQGPLPPTLGGVHRGQEGAGARHAEPQRPRPAGGLAHPGLAAGQRDAGGLPGEEKEGGGEGQQVRHLPDGPAADGHAGGPGPVNGFWRGADWVLCRPVPGTAGRKWRPVEPGARTMAPRSAAGVGQIRAYGNCLVAPQAIEFVKAAMAAIEDMRKRQ